MVKNNLQHNLLTYIAYCLPTRSFSYGQCQADLVSAKIQTTLPNLRKEFSLAKKEGLIEFRTFYKKPYPVLSSQGRLAIKTHLPFRRFGEFDSWKIVVFDLPENLRAKRLRLQNELKKMGFGRLARAVYISPHPLFSAVKRIAKKMGAENNITLIKTSSIENEKAKIFHAWNLKELNYNYENFIQKAKVMSFEHKPFWPLYAKALEKEFAALYAKDPNLPEQFLPADWQGQEAYAIFKAVSNSY